MRSYGKAFPLTSHLVVARSFRVLLAAILLGSLAIAFELKPAEASDSRKKISADYEYERMLGGKKSASLYDSGRIGVGGEKVNAGGSLELIKGDAEYVKDSGIYYKLLPDGRKIRVQGVEAKAVAEAVVARLKGEAKAQLGDEINNLHAAVAGTAEVVARAQGHAGLTIDELEGVKAGIGGEAFAGARAEGEASAGLKLFGIGIDVVGKGEAYAGIGANANVDFQASPSGKLEFSAGAGAALGLGFGGDLTLRIDVSGFPWHEMLALVTNPDMDRRLKEAARRVADPPVRASRGFSIPAKSPGPEPASLRKPTDGALTDLRKKRYTSRERSGVDVARRMGDSPVRTSRRLSIPAKSPDLKSASLRKPSDGAFTNLRKKRYTIREGSGGVDLIFVIDTTDSMKDDIAEAKASALAIVGELFSVSASPRIALVAFRDFSDTDTYVTKPFPFTHSKKKAVGYINALTVGGGGDIPEAVHTALLAAINTNGLGRWRNGVAKIIILMGDAPPHSRKHSRAEVVRRAAEVDPAHIFPIALKGHAATLKEFSELARQTGGKIYTTSSAAELPRTLRAVIVESVEHVRRTDLTLAKVSPENSTIAVVGVVLLGWVLLTMISIGILLLATHKGGAVDLSTTATTSALFGRDQGCTFAQAADPHLSRRHGRIQWDGQQLNFENLSPHGSLVDGNPIIVGTVPVKTGTQITMGMSVFQLESDGPNVLGSWVAMKPEK